jgi:hypothetical protein
LAGRKLSRISEARDSTETLPRFSFGKSESFSRRVSSADDKSLKNDSALSLKNKSPSKFVGLITKNDSP